MLDGIEIAHTVRGRVVSVGIGPTDSWKDLKRSLQVRRVRLDYGLGFAHRGYYDGAQAVWGRVKPLDRPATRLKSFSLLDHRLKNYEEAINGGRD